MQWGIENFKGLRTGEIDLQQGELTVLAGVNSSGKSSALQSILMMTQSLYHPGGIVLNGPLVRLGEADDLVRSGASDSHITLNLGVTSSETDTNPDPPRIAIKAKLRPSSDNSTLYATRLEFSSNHPDDGIAILDKNRSRSTDLESVIAVTPGSIGEEFLHLKDTFHQDKKELRTYVRMQGLQATEVIQVASEDVIATKYRSEVTGFLNRMADDHKKAITPDQSTTDFESTTFEAYIILNEFFQLIRRALDRRKKSSSKDLRKLLNEKNPFVLQDEWRAIDRDLQQEAIELAIDSRSQRPYIMISMETRSAARHRSALGQRGILERRLEKNINNTLSALDTLGEGLRDISSKVEYLGPLRDEPRVAWNQWNELSKGLPVGTRGEYSAVRLSQNTNRHRVTYTRPDGKSVTDSLGTAVDDWVSYLQIGESVSASVGKLGVRLELKLEGQLRDLTAVGVGVSQALPLVVAVLLVPPKSIFIVEQPELHLHPAVQARLADFMVGARPDISCLVETHSEAFLTRIRRRVAEGHFNTERIKIKFVEPSESGSVIRTLSLTEFGDLSDWPSGFLSGSDEDSKAILTANMKRLGHSS